MDQLATTATLRYAEPPDRRDPRLTYDPEMDRETVALFCGDEQRAQRWLRTRQLDSRGFVAIVGGSIVGWIDYDMPGDPHQSRLSLLTSLLRATRGRLSWRTVIGRIAANTPYPDDALVINSIRVLPAWRGYGIGTKLLRRVEEEAVMSHVVHDIGGIALQVLTDNPAIRLYMREGFVPVDRQRHPWYLDGVARTLMVKAI